MNDDKFGIPKSIVIGWIMTFLVTIVSAYITFHSQLARLDKEIELLKLRIEQTAETTRSNQERFLEIRDDIRDIKSALNLKVDKKFQE
jgi:hypothetical protein